MSYNPYQPTPSQVPSGKSSKDVATERVKTPGILLLVSGVVSMITSVFGGMGLAGVYLGMQEQILTEMANAPQDPELTPEMMEMTCNVMGWGGVAWAVFGFIAGLIVILGAVRMMKLKGWSMALMAAVVSLIPCFQGCCVLAIPAGIYAMVILFDSNVKQAFD